MKKVVLALTTFTLGFSAATVAVAGNRSGAISFSPMVSYFAFDNKQGLENEFMPNLNLGYGFNKNWGAELGLGWFRAETDTTPSRKVDGGLYTLNGLYHFLPDQHFDPYLTAGVGILYQHNPLSTFASSQSILNAGGGAQYFVTQNIALRGDVRDVYTMNRGTHDLLFGLGLSFLFGGEQPAMQQTVSDAIVSKDIALAHYGVDKDQVPADAINDLQSFAQMMKKHPNTHAEIVGHTDSTGTAGYNMQLSQRRATNVENYLVGKLGVDATSLSVTAAGQTQPLSSNKTKDGRAQNRRVDAVIHS